MGVLGVTETFRGQTADQDNKGIRNFVRIFQVQLASRTDSPSLALGAADVPAMYATYPDDSACTLRKKGASRMDDHPQMWKVQCEYNNQNDAASKPDDQSGQSPTDRAVKVTCTSVEKQKVLDRDYSNPRKAVINSAGEKFDPPIETEDAIKVITVVRNEASYDLSLGFAYENRVNTDTWNGLEPGYVRCKSINGTDKYELGVRYWEVTYVFEVNPVGWDLEVLDQGYTEIVGGKVALIGSQKDGTPLSKPALLNGAGQRLAVNGTPVFLPFKRYRETTFGPLGLNGILA